MKLPTAISLRPSRRGFLRASGIALGLPWLESVAAAAAPLAPGSAEAATATRFACLFMPNGVHVPSWRPREEGRKWKLTPTLEPLAGRQKDVTVLTGLRNRNSYAGEGHYVKTTALLSGQPVRKTGGHDVRCGVSLDQFAARQIGAATPLPTLELAIDPVSNIVDMGYSTVYGAHISWRDATTPVPREIRPQLAFDRLFRTARLGDPGNRLLLDTLKEDAKRLQGQVSSADAAKLAEFYEAVHAVEKRVRSFSARQVQNRQERLAGRRREDFDPKDHATHVRLMLELIVLAFRADATRLCTFMFGNAVSGRNFSFVDGVRGGFHPLSHHQGDPKKQRQYALINRWHVAQYAWLLEQLAGIRENGRSLLDRSAILFASGIGDGNSHDPKSLPVLLAGRGGGRLQPGRHIVCRKDRRLCSMHLAVLHALGVRADRFGDSDRPLAELFARGG